MPNPGVHFEILGTDPRRLREFYARLFDWEADTDSAVAPEISEPGEYGFISAGATAQSGIPGGIGGGTGHRPLSIFYVGVPDVGAALQKAENSGGRHLLGPVARPGGGLVVAHFADPEGNVIRLAGPH